MPNVYDIYIGNSGWSIFTICAIIRYILGLFPGGDCYDAIKSYAHNCCRDRGHLFPDIAGRGYLLHYSLCKDQENSIFDPRSDPDIYITRALPCRRFGGVYSKYYGRLRPASHPDGLRSASHHYALIKAGPSARENDQSPL